MKQIMIILLLSLSIYGAKVGRLVADSVAETTNLSTYVTSRADSTKTFWVEKNMTVTTNTTIGRNLCLGGVRNNAKITINNGVTLTIKRTYGEFPESTFVGSGSVVFDTCATDKGQRKWAIPAVAITFTKCDGDTVYFNNVKATVISATQLTSDSSNSRIYVGALKGRADFASRAVISDSAGGSVRAVTANRADSARACYASDYATEAAHAENASNASNAQTAGYADQAAQADSSLYADSSRVSHSLNGGTVNATSISGDSAGLRSCNVTDLYIDNIPMYKLSVVDDYNVVIDPGYAWGLCHDFGFIFGSEATGLAIYNNTIQGRSGDSKITGFELADIDSIYNRIIVTQIIHSLSDLELTTVGGFTVDITGVTNWYSTGNLNLESIDGTVNIQSDPNGGKVNIAADTVELDGHNLKLNMPEIYFEGAYIDGINMIDNIKTIRSQKLSLKIDTVQIMDDGSIFDSLVLFTEKLKLGGDLYQMWGTATLNRLFSLNAHLPRLNYSVGLANVREESGVMPVPNYINCSDTSYFQLDEAGTFAFGGCDVGKTIYVRFASWSSEPCSLRAMTGGNDRNFRLEPYQTAQMFCYGISGNSYLWNVWINDY